MANTLYETSAYGMCFRSIGVFVESGNLVAERGIWGEGEAKAGLGAGVTL